MKKLYIADSVSGPASLMFDSAAQGAEPNFYSAWVGVLSYTVQIYFDFSGYCDMAIGLALMCGIRLPANFNSPYRATSVIDFWRRWHMTLSRLLREYVYVPLGGNRRGPLRRYTNLMTTMLVGGLWHGASWTFVLWGGLHGLYLMINHAWNAAPFVKKGFRLGPLGWALCFVAVMAAWVPFRAADWRTTLLIWETMAGLNGLAAPLELHRALAALKIDLTAYGVAIVSENERKDAYVALAVMLLGLGLAFFAPNALEMTQRFRPTVGWRVLVPTLSPRPPWQFRTGFATGVLVGLMALLALAAINAARPSEFLYFQF